MNILHSMMGKPAAPCAKGSRGEPFETAYYDEMGVNYSATSSEIKKAFRRTSLKVHPDRNGGDTEKFKRINTINEVLRDELKRRCYDAFGEDFENVENIGVFVESLTSETIGFKIGITLSQAIKGITKNIQIPVIEGRSRVLRDIHIHVRPGIHAGEKIIIHGKGNNEEGKLPGDVVCIVNIAEDPDFSRKGDCLIHRTKISLSDFIRRAPITVYHPSGESITILIEETDVFVEIVGKGATSDGNLYVIAEIDMPIFTDETRARMCDALRVQDVPVLETSVYHTVSIDDVNDAVRRTIPDQQEQQQGPPGCRQG